MEPGQQVLLRSLHRLAFHWCLVSDLWDPSDQSPYIINNSHTYIHCIYLLCTLYILTVYIVYTYCVHCIYLLCTLYILTVYIVYTYCVHCIYLLCTLYILTVYIVYTYCEYCIYLLCTLYILTVYIIEIFGYKKLNIKQPYNFMLQINRQSHVRCFEPCGFVVSFIDGTSRTFSGQRSGLDYRWNSEKKTMKDGGRYWAALCSTHRNEKGCE